jgi:hypothetical protein
MLKINDIVDFRTSMRGEEVAKVVYSVRRKGEVKNSDETTNKLKPLSHVI